jgi:hypothetical protein
MGRTQPVAQNKQKETAMKQESREYYNYWEKLNVKVSILIYTAATGKHDSNSMANVSVSFQETDQPVNGEDTFATLEEAKVQASVLVDRIKEDLVLSFDQVKKEIPDVTEDSQKFIGFNPDGGW